MTTSNKSDSLQPPKGGGFSPTLLMTIVSAFLAFEILYVGFYTFQFADRLSVNILLGAIQAIA